MKTIWYLFQQAAHDFGRANAATLASALAFHTMLSVAPLMLLVIWVADLLYADNIVDGQVVTLVGDAIGLDAAHLVEEIIKSNETRAWGRLITAISTAVALLFFASGMFHQLKVSLNQIWGVYPAAIPGLRRSVFVYIVDRLLALLMLLAMSIFLLFVATLSAIVAIGEHMLTAYQPWLAPHLVWMHFVISPLFLIIPFAMMYKFLPDARIAWRDAWVGASVTAVLFAIGERLLGIYLENVLLASFYGAAGTFVIILLWVYYLSMAVLYGAEFTKVYANQHGAKIVPAVLFGGYGH